MALFCVDCRHYRKPGWGDGGHAYCMHPKSYPEPDRVSGKLGGPRDCVTMRGYDGGCGPVGDLWETPYLDRRWPAGAGQSKISEETKFGIVSGLCILAALAVVIRLMLMLPSLRY